jgi:hypothetical protein
MEDECTYYYEQGIITFKSGEVVESQEEEGKEEHIEVPHDLYWEKGNEVSIEVSSASTHIPELPRG